MNTKWLWLAFLGWLLLASAGIFLLGKSNFKEFDPELKLSAKLMDLTFESSLLNTLASSGFDTSSPTVFHITSSACWCDSLSKPHAQAIDTWGQTYGLQSQAIKLNDYPVLRAFVPATPAVLVVGRGQDLVYFGPYSEGMGCFQKVGFVDLRMKPYFSAQLAAEQGANMVNQNGVEAAPNYSNQAQIQSEAVGCYCPQ